MKELQRQEIELAEKEKLKVNNAQRVKDMTEFLEANNKIERFDNQLVRRLIQSVKVVSKEQVIIQFKSGQIIERNVD